MQRVSKEALARTDSKLVFHQFPDKRECSNSSLILKGPKNKKSIRRLFMTGPLKEELQTWLKKLEQDETIMQERYQNCGLLFRLPNGQAVEQTLIRKWFEKWEEEHPEYGKIVFHALRHSSATYQLRISEGDVKAVQGNTGHSRADVLVNTYAHIQDEPRRVLSERFEAKFYTKSKPESASAGQAQPPQTMSGTMLLEIIRNADADIKRELARALFA